MHADEVATDESLVRRLIAVQFPEWSDLPVERVSSSGTDNALYRLGDALFVRMPRIHWAADDVAKEQRWLPFLAPQLPLAIPEPVGLGQPGEGYPWQWSVHRWLPGVDASVGELDLDQAAADLAVFVRALRSIPVTDIPAGSRNVHLCERDAATRDAIAELGDRVDAASLLDVWERVLAADDWSEPVWIHADLQPGNLLVVEGRITAVIDFGCFTAGDPAVDLLPAWNLLDCRARRTFREALGDDDAVWIRGRGWALSIAVIALPYYWESNPAIVQSSLRVIAELLADS